MTPRRVAGVVLAAGSSSRLGAPKQLLILSGSPVLAHTLSAVRQSRLSPQLLVLGFEAQSVAEKVNTTGFTVIQNHDYAFGQSSSVRVAVQSFAADVDAAVFVLGDQPEVEPRVIDALMEQFEHSRAPIVQPRYAEGRGNPVLIARSLFPELLTITGDTGARPLLARYAEQVALIDVSEFRRPGDIDTWEDFAAMRRRFGDVNVGDDA